MQLMILVDNAGGVLPAINHSPWNGVTLADFVMPFFLFIVGVSLALTYKVSLALGLYFFYHWHPHISTMWYSISSTWTVTLILVLIINLLWFYSRLKKKNYLNLHDILYKSIILLDGWYFYYYWSLSLTNYFFLQKLSCSTVATRKAIVRTLKLLILGLFFQGTFPDL